MLKNLRIAYKVWTLPILAAAALILIVIVAPRAVTENDDLMNLIETGYFPASELTRDLTETLAGIQRGLQDAAAAQDEEFLSEADSLREVFVAQLRGGSDNPSLDEGELRALEGRFETYYTLARATTVRVIREETGEGLAAALENMQTQYNDIRRTVEELRARGQANMDQAFSDARDNQRRSNAVLSQIAWFSMACIALLIVVSFVLVRTVTGPVNGAVAAANRLAEGDIAASIEVSSRDEIGQLLRAMQRMGEYLREMAGVAEAMAAGDLSVEVEPRSGKDTLGTAFRTMVSRLSATIGELRGGAQMLSTASREVSATSQTLSEGTSEQAASVEEAASSLEQMTASITQNATNSRQTEQMAIKGASMAGETGTAVTETQEAMRSIAEKISIVEEIAYQTNLLALNAAIEAARAGEHGKGFAVVATEVRRLAERSQVAAKEIGGLAASSVEVAERSGQHLEKLVPSIRKTAELVQEVAAASDEQSSGVSQINGAMNRVDQVAQRNASAAEELATTAEEMSSQAAALQKSMSFFNLDGHVKDEEATPPRSEASEVPVPLSPLAGARLAAKGGNGSAGVAEYERF
jgi:methyl-accepting chemotaxis protein